MGVLTVPEGKCKSNRFWKTKQSTRSSFQLRQGISKHLAKSFEEKELIRNKNKEMKALENEMIQSKKDKKIQERLLREEKMKRRMENEYKTSVYQTIKPEKLKGMSKKQLRMIKKTAMNKNGQVELVNPWGAGSNSNNSNSKKK
eukprot:gene8223-11129_t